MKKIIFCAVISLLFCSCESKFQKYSKLMIGKVWVLNNEELFTTGNPVKVFKGDEIKLQYFTENSIYIYDANGVLENVFNYEKVNENGELKIIVESPLNNIKDEFSVIASANSLFLIGGDDVNSKIIEFDLLKDEILNEKIIQK